MILEQLIIPKIQKIVEETGITMLFFISISLCFNYFGIFDISKLGIANLDLYLWIYLIGNITVANVLKFWNRRNNPICPKCQEKLMELKEYKCPKCGKLNFEKNKNL